MPASPVDILLVEDNPGDVLLVREMVRGIGGMVVRHVDRLASALEQVAAVQPDVVLLDLGLPDSQGLETVTTLVASGCGAAVVVLTGQDDDAVGQAALRAGAQDYVAKARATGDFLGRAIRYAIERQQARLQLSESERRFAALFEASPTGLVLIAADTRSIVQANAVAARLLARPPKQIVGQPCRGLLCPSSAEPCPVCDLGEDVARSESVLVDAGGRPISILRTVIRTPIDGVTYVLESLVDITDRKAEEQRRAMAMKVLSLLNRENDVGMLIGDILRLVKEHTGLEAVGIRLQQGDDFPYYETNGFAPGFVASERYLCVRTAAGEVVRDGDGQVLLDCMCGNVLSGRIDPAQPFFTPYGSFWTNSTTDLLASTTEQERHARTRNRCHGEGYESVALVPLRSGSATIGLLQLNDRRRGMFRPDVIEFFEELGASVGIALTRRRTKDALRASEQRYKRLVESSPDIIWSFSDKRGTVFASGQAERVLGYEPDHLCRNPWVWNESIHPDDRDRVRRAMTDYAAATSQPMDLEYRIADSSGAWQWIHERAMGRRVEADETIVEGISTLITARKQAEQAREKLEEQLRTSQKMEAIGSLAGGVAHDFNNLLSVILSFTGFAMEDLAEGDPRGEDLSEIKRAAERAVELTRQLLAFSRKQVLQPVPLSLNDVAERLEKMLRRILGEDIDLVQVLEPTLGLTLADPGQIEQVLMNLVVNARDAMPEGGKLTIETRNVELEHADLPLRDGVRAGSYVELAVTDTGGGMDAATRAKLFEPFFTTKDKGKGTGLGLSTVYGIVKQSGGDIWVYSEPARGTTFKIRLPRERVTTRPRVSPSPVVSGPVTGTETVLVAEDEEALRGVARRALEAVGYTVLAAADGEEALAASSAYPDVIHLLVTDVVMPKMSGRVLAERLAASRPELVVLYMSGYTDNAIVHHGVLDPGTAFLPKPFTAAGLRSKVREALDAAAAKVR